jgi:signal transduction histidine kinase
VFFSRAVDTEQATLFFDPIEKTFEEVGWQNALVGIYFGVLFALAVYNLLIYFALRVPFVGYYLIFMMSWAFISACLHGYINYVSGFALPFSLWVGPFTHLAIITGTLFTRSFLGTAVLAPKLDLYHRVVIALLVVFCLISMTPFDAYLIRWTSPGLELATLIQTLMVLITGMILMARGSKAARVFTLGFLVSVVGIVVTILTYRGILPQTNITRFAIQISSLFEMVFLAGAISLRLKQLASEQESLATERSERSRYQSLVGLAAHDLASPLSVIQLETELAERGGQMNWARIREAAEQQEQILNYIRKERIGGPESAPGVASLTFVPRVMESLLSRVAGRKGITLQLPESHEVAGLQVRMDSAILLNTVLRNLIENAIKFSPHGSSVKVSIEPKGSAWVKFSVTDAGIGMSKELLKQIESGASGAAVNRPGTDGERGTGMGLHLAWTMIRKAGGRMSVQSRTKEEGVSDSGTKFEFLLPVG